MNRQRSGIEQKLNSTTLVFVASGAVASGANSGERIYANAAVWFTWFLYPGGVFMNGGNWNG